MLQQASIHFGGENTEQIIIHIALFRWKEGITRKKIDSAFKQVKQLKEKCDGIVEVFVGKNYHKESRGFTHGVVVVARDQESLERYRQHPAHKVIAKDIEEMEEDSLGFDFKDLR
ncbi:MAG: Dabb family protein [Candidatus Aenigmarchaeota archaeon]|nr:Dabb family protein [Candidatus Aenigmarchaeota archaeon]